MNRNHIENLYRSNGLNDFKLKNTDDLLKCHEIDFKAVDGYSRLDDLNKSIYKKFIINIFNAWGLESRATLVPEGIYFVEETEYLAKEEDYFVIKRIVTESIDKSGLRVVLRNWEDEDYIDFETIEVKHKHYLRFEYEHDGRKEWLHVIKEGEQWY